jgi:translation initiation factor eIF-2B subunit gamma
VYVCRRSVLDAILEKIHLDSFREEFLPWLCKIQYQKLKRRKYSRCLLSLFVILITSSAHFFFPPGFYPEAYAQLSQSVALQHSTLLNLGAENDNALSPNSDTEVDISAGLKVGVVLHHLDTGFGIRVHDLYSYIEVNRRVSPTLCVPCFTDALQALSAANYTLPTDPENRALIDQKAQISADTIIGDSTKVSERTTIKKSIIGRHCIIGKMVKIVGCILLDHCIIEDGFVPFYQLWF